MRDSKELGSLPKKITLTGAAAYAAPVAGSYFFYIAMWSILPGVYGKYFGLKLSSIATVVLVIRLFDGVIDTTIGYLSDWHRNVGGSRMVWVVVGALGSIVTCYFLFTPPSTVTTGYYLCWSLAYFLAFTIGEIPHLTWGSDLSMDYQVRATVFGVRNISGRIGTIVFYALPLLPYSESSEYTPQVLRGGVYIGAAMMLFGLIVSVVAAPAGRHEHTGHGDRLGLLLQSLTRNTPLLIYLTAFAAIGIAVGMWSGLTYFYLDGFLKLGDRVAVMFIVGSVIGTLSAPFWLKLINRTSKVLIWAIGIGCFLIQSIGMTLITPGVTWWIPLTCVALAQLAFACHEIAALSLLGDIVDYGKLKFRRDRGATYFGVNTFIFKLGVGTGGGVALAVAGLFGFEAAADSHTSTAIIGLKLGVGILPACFSIIGLLMIWKTPITRRRHWIIQRRLEVLLKRSQAGGTELARASVLAQSTCETVQELP